MLMIVGARPACTGVWRARPCRWYRWKRVVGADPVLRQEETGGSSGVRFPLPRTWEVATSKG